MTHSYSLTLLIIKEDNIIGSIPACSSTSDTFLQIDREGQINFYNKDKIVDKATKEKIHSFFVLYVEKDSESRYYIVSNDSKLYIMDNVGVECSTVSDIKDYTVSDNIVKIVFPDDKTLTFNIPE